MRLDKFLKDCGLGSRKNVKQLIKNKRIKVDNIIVNKSELNINPFSNKVYLDDELIHYQEFYYFLLNKPKGYLSATTDNYQKTILDFFFEYDHLDLFPVGRLDKDTTGAIIITNDGTLAHQLISPKYHVDKVYIATLDKDVNENIKSEFARGIILDDELTLPCKFEKIDNNICKVTLHQGKYHQVKRMFEYFNYKVIDLHREKFAFLTIEDLNPGDFRPLSEEEIKNLKILTSKQK